MFSAAGVVIQNRSFALSVAKNRALGVRQIDEERLI
jgi:hypothetical protein